jgi:hypothetical protein
MSDLMISQCPSCGKTAKVSAEFEGREIECGCGATFTLKDDSDNESVQREIAASEFVVTDYRIGKSKTTDQYLVRFACGFCKGSLILNQKQLTKEQQTCKECGKGYRLSKKILADVKEQELTDRRNKEELVLKKQKDHAKKRAARQERELQLDVESQIVLPGPRSAKQLDVESEIVLPGPRSAKQHEPLPNEPLPKDDFDKGNTKKELRLLATQSKAEGLKESKEKFPNVPRFLWLSKVCRNISLFCQAILGVLLFSNIGMRALKLGDEKTQFTVLALSVIWVLLMVLNYIIWTAGIELYKVFLGIEDNSRKNNALVAGQIEMLEEQTEMLEELLEH